MRRLGLIGGMSWESSAEYYRLINEGIRECLGGLHSADLLMLSVDFEPVERLQHAGKWNELGEELAAAARDLERGGARGILLATNTMHKVADAIEEAVGIPLLHIADATGERLVADGIGRVGLLGTAFTMEEPFYRQRLEERFGLEVLVPEASDRERVHRVIYDELCLGITRQESKEAYLRIVEELAERGARAVILGCTEIGLLIRDGEGAVPFYDTTRIHAQKGVEFLLGDGV
ncbi:aspartate/glutamate racemase family protein [Nitratifractor sp.]